MFGYGTLDHCDEFKVSLPGGLYCRAGDAIRPCPASQHASESLSINKIQFILNSLLKSHAFWVGFVK